MCAMKPSILIVMTAVGVGMNFKGLWAHHSIAGVYDSSRQVRVEGVVSEFHFINPHPFLIVDVKAGVGTEPWKLEMDNRSELVDVGMTGQTLQRGDRVIVTGSPVREPRTPSLYIRKLDRPADGFRYEQVGSRPRISWARGKPRIDP